MGKGYGSRSKDDILEENATLRQQIEFYEFEDGHARNRHTALSFAVGLAEKAMPVKAEDILADAKLFEEYLNGKPSANPDDPETPVPSPS